MKNNFILSILFLCSSHVFSSPPDYGQWDLQAEYSDEFDRGLINSKKWNTNSQYWEGRAPGLYTKSNVMQWNNELLLITHDDSNASRKLIRTGFLKHKKLIKYGYFEIKAKTMANRAASAFWLYRYKPNATFEIDIAEISHSNEHSNLHHSNAHVYYGDPDLESDKNRLSAPKTWVFDKPLSNDYHLYGFEWDQKELRWYFDNKLIRTKKNKHWHLPMYIQLTTEIIPDWFGIPSPNLLPSAFHIDYIKIWKKRF